MLAELFQAARPDDAEAPSRSELEALLGRHLEEAHRAWPEIELGDAQYVQHLARHVPPGGAIAGLEMLRGADLYLACACARGDARAVALFEERYFTEIEIAGARLRAGRTITDEVKQMLRRILFVAAADRLPAVATYAGRGDLRGWIRVSAVRELQRLLIRERRDVPFDDERLLDVLSPAADPELAWLREVYRTELAAAMRSALTATPPRERSLLRYQLVDGLSIDQIGALHGVHRATAARWLAQARGDILERTRAELVQRLGAAEDEVDSIIRLVHSRLDVSVERILRD